MKLNISDPKTAKTYSVEADEKTSLMLLGKKIKDEVELKDIAAGLKVVITGGSDKQGFPMSPSLDLDARKIVYLKKSVGFRPKRKGERRRKRVAGKIINENTQQVNLKIISGDPKVLDEKHSPKKKDDKK